jgi:DNA-binding beta-propeller fold protein YncE
VLKNYKRREFLSALAAAGVAPLLLSAQARRVRTVAGTGAAGFEAGEVNALRSPITNPYGIVPGPDGALYFCEVDTGYIRRLDITSGRMTTIAGNGQKGYAGDGGPALSASFTAPHEIRFDRNGHLFVVERDAHVVRRIDAKTRVVSTVAGTGVAGFSGDEGPAAKAALRQPHSIAFDAAGNLLVCDIGNSRVRRVDMATGTISTFAGTGERRAAPDEAPLDGTPLQGPRSIDTDSRGNAYLVLREGNAVLAIDTKSRLLKRIAGTGQTGFTGDGRAAIAATFNGPKGIACAPDGSLAIVDTENHAIRQVNLTTGVITTLVGTGQRGDGPDGDPMACAMARPHGVCFLGGRMYVTDSENHRIRVLE